MQICSNYLGILHSKYILIFEMVCNTFSTVYQAINSFTSQNYIVKIFHNNVKSIEEEIKISKKISESNNPYFIKYIDSSNGDLIFDEVAESKRYIVFENVSKGDLMKYISKNQTGFSEKICKFIFYKIVKAIQFLHNLGICHRNIKIENILLDGENYHIKIWDFSLAAIIKNEKGEKILLNKKLKASNYTAPEIIKGYKYDGEKIDVYSLGELLFILRTGVYVFKGDINNNLNKKLYQLIKLKKSDIFWNILESMPNIKGLSPEFKNLYFQLVAPNPKDRPNFEEILAGDYLKEINSLNEQELKNYEKEMIKELKHREEILNL